MSRKIRRFGLVGLIIGGSIAIFIAMAELRPEAPKREAVAGDPLVDTIDLEPSSFRFTVSSQGSVLPRTETVLSAEVTGTIVEISPKFVAGGVFDADEVLMRIDPTNYRVAVRQAEALVKQRQIEFDGSAKLRTQGYRAETEYAAAEAALASAEAELTRARRDLERTAIRLPFEGMVRSKEADLGQFVNLGTRLGVVFATDLAEVRLPLTDQDLAFVELPGPGASGTKADAGVKVRLHATRRGTRESWDAVLVRTEGVVDADSRVTFAVARIVDPYALHSEKASLPVGTFVTATIAGISVEDVVAVPRYAMRAADRVWVADADRTLRARSVHVVRADADFAYIDRGFEPGDRLVVTALEAPVNGLKVRIDSESGSAATDPASLPTATSAPAMESK